jgi:DNA-binding transcriptional MocR family regulator
VNATGRGSSCGAFERVESRRPRAGAHAADGYDFRVGVPDMTLFPFETWRRFVSRGLLTSSCARSWSRETAWRWRNPAIRLGFLVAPQPLRRALRLAKHLTDWHWPPATQAALARFIDGGLLAPHIRKVRTEYKSRHERMLLSEFYAGDATQCGLVPGYGAVALDKIDNGLQLLWRLLDCP